MEIRKLSDSSEKTVARINELLDMLNPEHPSLSRERLELVLASPETTVFVALSDDGCVAGMLSLLRCRCIFGDKFWIEDVVVDAAYRGHGIGSLLVEAAKDEAASLGGHCIELTSNPSRPAARKLYLSSGFVPYETGVFKFYLQKL